MKERLSAAVQANLDWFQNSGVMRPADGFWGVAERLLVVDGNAALERIRQSFPLQTRLDGRIVAVEHRRADCAAETALLFELAAAHFGRPEYRDIARNLIGFMLDRSNMRYRAPESERHGLWAWAMQNYPAAYTDDNAWVGTVFLLLSRRGYPELEEPGLAIADAMFRHLSVYLDYLDVHGRDAEYKEIMAGTRLNPHWFGLVTMALAWAYRFNRNPEYVNLIRRYYALVPGGPPSWDRDCRVEDPVLKWSVSEYAYLTLTAAIVARTFADPAFTAVAAEAADILLSRQTAAGNFVSNHYEAPKGTQFADLIYTQNWATLGLLHTVKLFPEQPQYRVALDRSLALLLRIQDRSESPYFHGCWRGMFDCATNDWGGGDRYEGGQNSIYSGWTNAPVSIALLCELTGGSLFPE